MSLKWQLVWWAWLWEAGAVMVDLADLINLDELIRNASIFGAVELRPGAHHTMVSSVRFRFSRELVGFLQRFNTTQVVVTLLNFTSNRMPLFTARLPLLLASNASKYCNPIFASVATEINFSETANLNKSLTNLNFLVWLDW